MNIKNLKTLLFLVLLMPGTGWADHASANFETGTAGAVMTIPGSTMPKGKMVIGASIQLIEFNAIPVPRTRSFSLGWMMIP